MHKGRGYKISVQHDGQPFHDQHLVWGVEGQLPAVWSDVKHDETVKHAEIRYNAGPRKRARNLLDEYIRPATEEGTGEA